MLRAPKGKLLLSVDLSQAEAWIVAYCANEPTMKLELQFGDIHKRTARTILDIPARDLTEDERYTGKKCNHAFNYLMGPDRAAEVINKEGQIVVTVRQTKIYRKKYLELYRIENWWLDVENQLKQFHTITTPYGFTRRFYNSGKEGLKEGVAFIPQSTVADHMYGRTQPGGIDGGLKLVEANIIRGNRSLRIIHSAHDSCIIEFDRTMDIYELYGEVKKYIKRPMVINGEEFTIPCDAKVGERWEEFEKLKEVA
jgi:hypothetical protein